MKAFRTQLGISLSLLTAFALWTLAVLRMDVQPIGPQGSCVGLAGLNGGFHRLIGVNMTLYTVTDWLGLVPVGICAAFGLLGLGQWIRRRSLRRVDGSLLVLGGFYIVVMAAYALFEVFVVNRRPVLIGGVLEASYPSSTTMLVMCVIPTAIMQLAGRIRRRGLRIALSVLLTAFLTFMVAGRLLSGVHWITDIVGGALLSAALVMLYRAVTGRLTK